MACTVSVRVPALLLSILLQLCTISSAGKVADHLRFDCSPHGNSTRAECESRGCMYQASETKVKRRWKIQIANSRIDIVYSMLFQPFHSRSFSNSLVASENGGLGGEKNDLKP